MAAHNRNQVNVTPKASASHLAELRRRVKSRGGTRFVDRGALKLTVPRATGTAELVP
jgi:hypothetical protein